MKLLLKRLLQTLAGLVVVSTLVFTLYYVPKWLVDEGPELNSSKLLVEYEVKHRETLLKLIGGLFVLLGFYFAWRRIKTADKTAAIAEQGQITERFTHAIDQLGNDRMEIRLGGIYALERIMRDSKNDHWTIVEVLAAFVRRRAPWPPTKEGSTTGTPTIETESTAAIPEPEKDVPRPAEDIKAALSVLGRRPRDVTEPGPVDLRTTDLRRANLWKSHLPKAWLNGANLKDARLDYAYLKSAWLNDSNLQSVRLDDANLKDARLGSANLKDALLNGANLQGAWLKSTNLKDARLNGANLQDARLDHANLQGARLDDANLQGALLNGANLQGAKLNGANLQDAWLSEVRYLTAAQLLSAKTLHNAKIKPELAEQVRAQKPGFLR